MRFILLIIFFIFNLIQQASGILQRMERKLKSTELRPQTTTNRKTFTWKEKELDQLFINTYRHFRNRMREIKVMKPNQIPEINWVDLDYFQTDEESRNPQKPIKRAQSKKYSAIIRQEENETEQPSWLLSRQIKGKVKSEKKESKGCEEERPGSVLLTKIFSKQSQPQTTPNKTIYIKKKKQIPVTSLLQNFDSQTIVDLILKANHVELLPYPSPYFLYFNVYVEDGNNSQMVKQVLRKRSGWRVVEMPSVANLIWSQFYKSSLDTKPHKRMKDLIRAKQKVGDSELRLESERMSIFQKWENQRGNSCGKTRDSKMSINSLDNTQYQKELKKLCPQNQHLKNISFKKVIQAGPSLHLYNRFPNHQCISDKKSLLRNMTILSENFSKDVFDIIPFSIEIKENFVMEEIQEILKRMKCVWIIKPGENSNRGRGITVCQDQTKVIEEIVIRLKNEKKQEKKLEKSIKNCEKVKVSLKAPLQKVQSLILQQYIQPLLYNKRKIDLRMFLLITSVKGKIRGYLYEEGYFRTASRQFTLDNFDKYVHLTNDAIQIDCPDYGKYEEGNKISWKKFQQWIKDKNQGDLWSKIQFQLKKISSYIIKASKNELIKKGKKRYHQRSPSFGSEPLKLQQESIYFEVFGLDFLIDKLFKVWLIQVNTNPSLNTDCSRVVRNLIPRVLDNAFDIAVEPYARSTAIFNSIPYQNHFQVIYDDEWK